MKNSMDNPLLPLYQPLLSSSSSDEKEVPVRTLFGEEFFKSLHRVARENAGRDEPGVRRQNLFFDMIPNVNDYGQVTWLMPWTHAVAIMLEDSLGYRPLKIVDLAHLHLGIYVFYEEEYVNQCMDEIIHAFNENQLLVVEDIEMASDEDFKEEEVEEQEQHPEIKIE